MSNNARELVNAAEICSVLPPSAGITPRHLLRLSDLNCAPPYTRIGRKGQALFSVGAVKEWMKKTFAAVMTEDELKEIWERLAPAPLRQRPKF